jgi:hypothetical protein
LRRQIIFWKARRQGVRLAQQLDQAGIVFPLCRQVRRIIPGSMKVFQQFAVDVEKAAMFEVTQGISLIGLEQALRRPQR